nr:unnamed protein product [Spirometra erinaceieuropaei]
MPTSPGPLLRAANANAAVPLGGAGGHRDVQLQNSQQIQRLEELPAADKNASVETRWCQLRDAVQLDVLAALRRTRRHHHDLIDGNDAAISNRLVKKNRLHRAYLGRPNDANKAAFYQYRPLLSDGCEKNDVWITSKAEEIQGYADRNEPMNFFAAIKTPSEGNRATSKLRWINAFAGEVTDSEVLG